MDTKENPKSRWVKMRDEARARVVELEPYIFDGTEPPTIIRFPNTAEKVLELQRLWAEDDIDVRGFLECLLGDQFDIVWSIIRDAPLSAVLALLNDIGDHFGAWRLHFK